MTLIFFIERMRCYLVQNNEEKQKYGKLFSVHFAKEKLNACRWINTVVDEKHYYSFRRRRRRH
jgi:hypothetical protein